MDRAKAKKMYENASAEVGDPWEPHEFSAVDATTFLGEYCWVVFVSGFRYAVVRKHFDALTKAFANFDLDAVAKIDEIDVDTLPIRNERKATGFLRGARQIADEGYDEFKERLWADGKDVLDELPGIGPKTKKHLAMVIGLEDTAKDDVWLVRCAEACSMTVGQLVSYLSKEFDETKQRVDAVLWEYCEEFQEIPPTT